MNKEYLRNLWYKLPTNQRFLVRRIYYFPIDLFDTLTGNKHKYVPSRGNIYTGSPAGANDYIKQGEHQLKLLANEINLNPNDYILDIGSGLGRTAIALTSYLNTDAKYEGFDVVKQGVDWCNSNLGKDYSNFNFTYIPLFNDLYNKSTLQADEFIFPYKQQYFDKIFSFSVFTHMRINEIQHYFKEINKVLKSDGLIFSTFFLYDNNTEDYISKKDGFNFPIKKDGYRIMNEKVQSGNIAIHIEKLKEMLLDEGLTLVKVIDGFWKGKSKTKKTIEYQDIAIFKKQ